ncbi:hypothetical protein QOT17_002979 [Balamuthia mandrillaris]
MKNAPLWLLVLAAVATVAWAVPSPISLVKNFPRGPAFLSVYRDGVLVEGNQDPRFNGSVALRDFSFNYTAHQRPLDVNSVIDFLFSRSDTSHARADYPGLIHEIINGLGHGPVRIVKDIDSLGGELWRERNIAATQITEIMNTFALNATSLADLIENIPRFDVLLRVDLNQMHPGEYVELRFGNAIVQKFGFNFPDVIQNREDDMTESAEFRYCTLEMEYKNVFFEEPLVGSGLDRAVDAVDDCLFPDFSGLVRRHQNGEINLTEAQLADAQELVKRRGERASRRMGAASANVSNQVKESPKEKHKPKTMVADSNLLSGPLSGLL